MDAAVPVDAQTAPTGTWKTAQTAVSHSAHTHHRVFTKEPKNALHTKILTLPFPRLGLGALAACSATFFMRPAASSPE